MSVVGLDATPLSRCSGSIIAGLDLGSTTSVSGGGSFSSTVGRTAGSGGGGAFLFLGSLSITMGGVMGAIGPLVSSGMSFVTTVLAPTAGSLGRSSESKLRNFVNVFILKKSVREHLFSNYTKRGVSGVMVI